MIEAEWAAGRGNPEAETRVWLERIAVLDRKRSRLQDMAAEGHITFEELGQKLRETDEARGTAERELAEVEGRRARIEELEQDRDALLERYAGLVPAALEELSAEERHQVYRMLRLRAHLHRDGGVDVEGVLREPVCTPAGTPWCVRDALAPRGGSDPRGNRGGGVCSASVGYGGSGSRAAAWMMRRLFARDDSDSSCVALLERSGKDTGCLRSLAGRGIRSARIDMELWLTLRGKRGS